MLSSVGVDLGYAVSYDSHRRLSLQRLAHRFQFPRRPPVVAIQKCHDLPAALRYSLIKRRSLSALRFPQRTHTAPEPLHDLRCAINRSIIDDNDLTVSLRKILLQHAHNRLLNKSFVVVGID